jgi:hypothetical protein
MKRFLIGLVGMGVLLWVTPALATVIVTATIDKDKDITITETITIVKNVILDWDVTIIPQKAAESLALANQENSDNTACSNCAEKRDNVSLSFSDNSGVVDGNQAAGNMNNQGNAVSIAVDAGDPIGGGDPNPPNLDVPGFAESQAHAEQQNHNNLAEAINLIFRDANINSSFNRNTGVVGFNQSPGNMNNQVNLVSLAVALTDTGVALSEADLGQFNINNVVMESDSGLGAGLGIHKSANIFNSLNDNTGVVGVNQSAGNMANQGNVVSMAFVTGPTGNDL